MTDLIRLLRSADLAAPAPRMPGLALAGAGIGLAALAVGALCLRDTAAGDRAEELRDGAEDSLAAGRDLVRRHPVLALSAGAGIGMALAMLLRPAHPADPAQRLADLAHRLGERLEPIRRAALPERFR